MARILVTDGMAPEGVQLLVNEGHEVDLRSLSPDDLLQAIGAYDALVVRSATQVTAAVLQAGLPRLKLVGRAGVGVDNVAVEAATRAGIVVMNAPLGNILSAAEHSIGLIFAAARNIPQAHGALAAGTWDKKSFIGVELHGKTLGVIGLGKIGKHVAQVMQAAGMEVIAHDPFLSQEVAQQLRIEPVALEELLHRSDIISLHVPLTDKTRHMIDAKNLQLVKPSLRLVNVARGGIINETDLAQALRNGVLAGAALDVFGNEPLESDSPLFGCPNLILTPHLGASTEEAQVRVSTDISEAFNLYFAEGRILNAVNVQLRVDPAIDGYLQAAELLGGILAQTMDLPMCELEVRARGELAQHDVRPLAVAALKGAMAAISDEPVSMVNAQLIAESRGITLSTSASEQLRDNMSRLALKAVTREGEHTIGGSLVEGQLRLLRYGDYTLDLPINGNLLILEYPDRPGMVGRYGSILGENQINIARMEVSRIDGRGDALVVLTLDDPVPNNVLDELRTACEPRRCHFVSA